MAVKAKAKRKNKKLNKKNKFIIALSVVLAFALAIGGSALVFRGREKVYYDFGKETARGYDVSEHNGKIDWQSLKNEVDFVFIRVGYRGYGTGTICEDKCAKDNLKGAQEAGIPYGVYLYSYSTSVSQAKSEAQHALRLLEGRQPALPVFIDYEESRILVGGTALLGDMAKTF